VQPGVAVFAILDDYSKFKDIKRVEEGEVREDEKVLIQILKIKKRVETGATDWRPRLRERGVIELLLRELPAEAVRDP
jgi:hypothetical protein